MKQLLKKCLNLPHFMVHQEMCKLGLRSCGLP